MTKIKNRIKAYHDELIRDVINDEIIANSTIISLRFIGLFDVISAREVSVIIITRKNKLLMYIFSERKIHASASCSVVCCSQGLQSTRLDC